MANDHYIPRCLTRPWHDLSHGREALRYFDFDDGRFHHRNSRKLFAKRGVNTPMTERYLAKYIDEPIAIAQDKIVAAGADFARIEAEFAKVPHTALTGIYWLQTQRIRDATRAERKHHLNEFAKKGYAWLEALSAVMFQDYEPLLCTVGNALFFPDTGMFPIPLPDQQPVLALPIHTGLVLVFADRRTRRDSLRGVLNSGKVMSAYSIGLTPRRIVVPPEMQPLASTIISLRRVVREKFEIISDAGRTVGLTTWGLRPPEPEANSLEQHD